jgi:hypothetical protein
MGFLDRLFGAEPTRAPRQAPPPTTTDEQALQRYRYMLETAPPETIEQAHAEAFAKLTPEQRRQVLAGLAQAAPPNERSAIEATPLNDTRALARTATRAEIRQPGVMERTLGGGGMGFGTSLLSSFAMGFVGSMVANSFLDAMGGFGGAAGNEGDAGNEGNASDDTGGETADNADWGDSGGDFDGGGDFDV